MSKKKVKKSPEPLGDRFRSSIVYKLSLRLVLRLFSIFLTLDILICLLAAGSAIVYSERTAAIAAQAVLKSGLPDEPTGEWLSLSGFEIKETQSVSGKRAPEALKRFLPELTASATRRIDLVSDNSGSIYDRIKILNYVVGLDYYGVKYEVFVRLSGFLYAFIMAFIVLSVIELYIIVVRAFRDARLVRNTLKPISELTRVAQSLNSSEAPDLREMEALAGKLEGINASRLDTRIQVSETQDELKSLAKAINSMLDRINESYRAQVRFVSDASHELRTPISVIQGYANLLDRWGKNDEKTLQESIVAIKEEAANMKELVEQLLFLARGDNNTIKLNVENFKLSDLIEEVRNETRMIDGAHNFDVRLSDASVSADKALVKQALRILVDNSIKYTEPGGNITIASSADAGFSRLSVQDDGIGIRAEAVPQIFERFFRGDESRARATGGAGLGLSIAKWIVMRHGGHMEVLSREGIGTRITLILPASSEGAFSVPA